jgi:pimeloyl-ACP methyl ester carboxylesterase
MELSMMRRLLQVLGALVLGISLLFAAAWSELEWQARAAARAGSAALAAAVHSDTAPDAITPGAAPALILLHGAGLNGHMWDPVSRYLDPSYRTITIDLPGHGLHGSGAYSLDGAVAAIIAAAHSAAPAPVILVGDSLGGFSAMAAAPYLPREQLAGLVLAGSTGEIDLTGVAAGLVQTLVIRGMLLFVAEDRLAERALGRFGIAGENARNILAAGVRLRAVAPAMRSLEGVDFRARLAAVDAPVLIINGTLDRNAMAQEAGFVAAARHAETLHFENCEHGVSMRRPAEFAAAVNAFATRIWRHSQPPPAADGASAQGAPD